MLNVYFDATRVWLGKVARSHLTSTLQDSALDLDMSVRATSKGLSSKFGALFALRFKPASSGIDEAKFIKLKVRVKAIVEAIVKAIDKQDIPAGILDFWRRLTSDGVYFPESVRSHLVRYLVQANDNANHKLCAWRSNCSTRYSRPRERFSSLTLLALLNTWPRQDRHQAYRSNWRQPPRAVQRAS